MKQYNGEKGIISLTSWTKRIPKVHIPIMNILKNCPDFHVVLVLAEEEFPNKEQDLTKELKELIDLNLIEILWVEKNLKSYKKIMFTMEKYKNVPVISADDDCIYECNYAEILYNIWVKNKNHVVRFTSSDGNWRHAVAGCWTLYTYDLIGKHFLEEFKKLPSSYIEESLDDDFYCYVMHKYGITSISANMPCLLKFINQDTRTHQTPGIWHDYE